MDTTATAQIAALRRLCASELQAEWLRLYGEPAPNRNTQFLFRRLAWRIQELQNGGLSDRARQRLDELAPEGFTPARPSIVAAPAANPASPAERTCSRRDPRLPSPGSVISKVYKGRELRVVIREDGLELDGQMYASATALAKAVTGSKSINGRLFLGVAKRKR